MMKTITPLTFAALLAALMMFGCKKEKEPPPKPVIVESYERPLVTYLILKAAKPITDTTNNFIKSYTLGEALGKTTDISFFAKGYYEYGSDTGRYASTLFYLGSTITASSLKFIKPDVLRITTESLKNEQFLFDHNSYINRLHEAKELPVTIDLYCNTPAENIDTAILMKTLNYLLKKTNAAPYISKL